MLCISAHWDAVTPRLAGAVLHPAIQHDFYGFPPALYAQTWPARGDMALGHWLRDTLSVQGLPVTIEERPFDHGVWLPFKCIWPTAPLPVFQLSLCVRQGGPWHLALGEALAPLREAGVLIVGSGGITHNLHEIHWHAPEGTAASWSVEFMGALEAALASGDRTALCQPWTLPHGRRAHPTLEHYFPFLVALGAAGTQGLEPVHRNWMFGTLALHAYGSSPAGRAAMA